MDAVPTAGHDPGHAQAAPDAPGSDAPGSDVPGSDVPGSDVAGSVAAAAGRGDVLDLLPDGVVIVGPDGSVVAVNDMAARLLAAPQADLVGRPAADVLALTDDAGNDWWRCAAPLAGDARVGQRLVERDLTLCTTGGRRRPVTVTARRVAPPAATHRGGARSATPTVVAVSLRPAEARRRVDAARSDLVSTVSHELRSPLTSVKGFTKTLLAKWERFDDQQKRHMLATIDEDADRVTRLLGELLDVSRIDAGRLRLSRQMVDLRGIAQRVLDAFAHRHPDREYGNEIPTGVPAVYADPDKMAQVLTNLVENATNYGSGRVAVAAQVQPARDGGQGLLRCTVSDEGGGIKPANLTAIFTKFHRRQGERHAGTGLGLYITRGIVEAHGGRVWGETEPGAATRFHFTLPLGGLELAGITEETRRLATERS